MHHTSYQAALRHRRSWLALAILASLAGQACTSEDAAPTSVAAEPARPSAVRTLTGAPTRIVWVQHDGSDVFALGNELILMGLDTEDGRGERALLDTRGNYAKPLISPAGSRVVFSNRHTKDIHILDWAGRTARRIADGFALAWWADPDTGEEWLYAGRDERDDAYGRVVRFPVAAPDRVELVWNQTVVGEDSFQVSLDGRRASGMFPWPVVGIADLPNAGLHRLGEGCWTALAQSGRPVCWFFDNAHGAITLVDLEEGRRWEVDLAAVPGFEEAEVYHPRWASDPRFVAISGPYDRGGANQVRTGGAQVEVYLGRFSADFARIESWVRVTHNDRADAYPDVWMDRRGGGPSARATGPARMASYE